MWRCIDAVITKYPGATLLLEVVIVLMAGLGLTIWGLSWVKGLS